MATGKPSLSSRLMLQLIISILSMFFLFMIIDSFWIYNRYKLAIDNHIQFARAISLNFQGLLRDIYREQYAIGNFYLELSPNSASAITRLLKSISEIYYAVNNFSIIDSSGQIITSSLDNTKIFQSIYTTYINQIRTSDTIFVSDLFPGDSTYSDGFITARSFRDQSGTLLFAVAAFVEADKLGEVTFNIPEQPDYYFTLFDSKGILVYSNQNENAISFSNRDQNKDDHLLKDALAGKVGSGFIRFTMNNKKTERIGARVPIEAINWVAGSAMGISTFFRPLIFVFVMVNFITIALAIILFIFAKRTVRTVVKALRIVQNHLNDVAHGNFSAIDTLSGFAEFDALIRGTNQMASQLEDRQKKLQLQSFVIENSNDFIIIASPDMVPTYLNNAGRRMVGIDIGKNVNQTRLIDYISLDDRKIIEEKAFPALLKNGYWYGEVMLRNFQTGLLIPTILSVFAVKNEKDELLGYASINHDLTQIKEAIRSLVQSEERFRKSIDGLLDAFVIMKPIRDSAGDLSDFLVEYSNRVALEFTEMKIEEHTGHLFSEVFHTKPTKLMKIYDNVLKTGKPEVIENHFVHADRGKYKNGIFIDIMISRLDGNLAVAFRDVTERVNHEQVISASEKKFRSLAENSPEVIARYDINFRHTYINSYGEKVYGMPRDKIIGKTPIELNFPPELTSLWTHSFDQMLKNKKQKSIEYDYDNPVMGHRYWSTLAVPEFDENKDIISVLIITRDISELKITEQKLRESEAFGRKILDSSLNGIYIVNLKTIRYDFLNSQHNALTGYTIDDLNQSISVNALDNFHPDDRELISEHLKTLSNLKDGETIQLEFRFRHKKGYWLWCLARETVFSRNEQGDLVQFIGSIIDITDKKSNEDKLRRSNQRYIELSNSMPQLVWTANPDGYVDYFNEKYRDFVGLVIDKNGRVHYQPEVAGEDRQQTSEQWNNSLKTGVIYQIEHRIKNIDGFYHWYLSRGVPARDKDGKIIKWYGTTTNIDISKQAMIALAESEKHLKSLNENLESLVIKRTEQVRALSKALILAEQRERKRFSQILHEDLQQVLFSAKMQIEIVKLEADELKNAGISEGVAFSMNLLTKALKITKNMSMELNPPILYSQGLDSAIGWLSSFMQQSEHLTVEFTSDDSISSIKDETQIMVVQMVRELLCNVVKHSGVHLATVNAYCEKKILHISVSDKGRGFNVEETRQKIETESKLGLFSIEERLKLFGGEFTINSTPGKGTTCDIRIPSDSCSK